jgi:hypothetical protein
MAAGHVARTVYLHIGLHKTGTTYLQSLFSSNREALRKQGVEYPGGEGQPSQVLAAYDLRGRRPHGHAKAQISGMWKALADHVCASSAPVALVSQESLALAGPREARRAVTSFPETDVHVIVTARDLGRALVSMWQEDIKSDATWTWREYVEAVQDPEQAARQPAFGFWRRQHLVRVCDTWASAVGRQRLHIVTVPPAGAAPGELVRRMASVVGFDPDLLTEPPKRQNEMIGTVGIELLRQVNDRLGGRLNEAQRARAVKGALVAALQRPVPELRPGLREPELTWAAEQAQEMIETVRLRGYEVTGDLEDLRPSPEPAGRAPDDATADELYAAALDSLASLTERFATLWWLRRGHVVEGEEVEQGDRASRRRGRAYAVKVKALGLADRSRLASKALAIVLRAEERTLERKGRLGVDDPDRRMSR